MKLRELKRQAKYSPLDLRLFSAEGDIYVLQINGWDWLSDKGGRKPMLFRSISEAKECLGSRLSGYMHLEQSEVYDEMITR